MISSIWSMLSNTASLLNTMAAKQTNIIALPESEEMHSINSIKPLASNRRYSNCKPTANQNIIKPTSIFLLHVCWSDRMMPRDVKCNWIIWKIFIFATNLNDSLLFGISFTEASLFLILTVSNLLFPFHRFRNYWNTFKRLETACPNEKLWIIKRSYACYLFRAWNDFLEEIVNWISNLWLNGKWKHTLLSSIRYIFLRATNNF